MKIVFMGTPRFALPSLESLVKDEEVVGVVTRPDRPKGRGRRVMPSPVKMIAEKQQLPLCQPTDLCHSQFRDWLRERNPEIIVVVAYGRILPLDVLGFPRWGCLNAHASLLPRYRGAAPIERTIIKGEKSTGVTIMRMNKGLDEGDILLQESVDIGPHDNAGILSGKLSLLSATLFRRSLEQIRKGKFEAIPQDDAEATYAPPLSKSDGCINWQASARDIHNLVRGLTPHLGAYTYIEENKARRKIFKIWRAAPKPETRNPKPAQGQPGEVMEIIKDEGLVVATGEGFLLIREVQEEGSRKMPAWEYVKGHPLNVGCILNRQTIERR